MSAILISGCGIKTQNKMETDNIFPKGNPLPKDWFVGNAFLFPLVAKDQNNDFSAGSVTFEPRARTNWHTHPRGQVLLIIEGEGWYQEKGKAARSIKKGDVVKIPENIEHWHGATSKKSMTHIAITNYKEDVQVTWLRPVNEEEYDQVVMARGRSGLGKN
jgi:quercetin dioxygenase-like cupin family protein